MLRGIGRYIRQHHVALLALFVALGGTALALDRNEVKSRHIAPGNVKLSDTNDRLRLKCPGGTRYHEGACIETAARGQAAWLTALFDCRDDGRRLPTVAELYEFRLEPNITLGNGEWGLQFDDDGNKAVSVAENGGYGDIDASLQVPYRCAVRPKR